MVKNLIGNNPQLNGLLNQVTAMTPEQRSKKLNEMCNQYGISPQQLKNFLDK